MTPAEILAARTERFETTEKNLADIDKYLTLIRREIYKEQTKLYTELDALSERFASHPEKSEIWLIEADAARAKFTLSTFHMRLKIAHVHIEYVRDAIVAPPTLIEVKNDAP